MPAIDEFLDDLSAKGTSEEAQAATSWSEAFDLLPEANVALFSIPREYGAPEMERALKMIYTCSLSRIMCQLKMKYV